MFEKYKFTAAERFMRYVQIDTQSDPLSDTHPTTSKQKDLSRLLAEELQKMGVSDAAMDEWGYVYGTIPSNTSKQVPVVCFCARIAVAMLLSRCFTKITRVRILYFRMIPTRSCE
jgi:tripeptide aminopeptidase